MLMALKSSIRHWNNTAVAGNKHQKQEMIQLTMTTSYWDAPKSVIPHKYTSTSSIPWRPHQATDKVSEQKEAHISHDICLCGTKLLLQYRSCLQ